MNLKLYIIFLISPFFLLAQEDTSVEGEVPAPLSKIEQLILDIESEIDIEKRFDFSRSNSKEKQLADLKRIQKKVKSDLDAAEDLSQRLDLDKEVILHMIESGKIEELLALKDNNKEE